MEVLFKLDSQGKVRYLALHTEGADLVQQVRERTGLSGHLPM